MPNDSVKIVGRPLFPIGSITVTRSRRRGGVCSIQALAASSAGTQTVPPPWWCCALPAPRRGRHHRHPVSLRLLGLYLFPT